MWTSTALASEHRRYRGRVWRLVEAQHRISTNRLASDLAEQELLETLADEVKPQLPAAARGLDYLLASPFRYGHRLASRFRRADERPGIFYASEREATAIAEAAYWRLRFVARSPGFAPPSTTIEHSSFSVAIASDRTLDLTEAPFAAREAEWTDPEDYRACQDLTTAARAAQTQALRTRSARDRAGCNLVVLDPAAFAERKPRHGKTWHLRYEQGRLVVLAALPHAGRLEFTLAGFGLDL
ncbi:MAG: RES family NAD+ phosphorylase [Sphingomonadales bacterium]|nr:RES family NAD+ phosphorylase [Sphingomonadales bacterium]